MQKKVYYTKLFICLLIILFQLSCKTTGDLAKDQEMAVVASSSGNIKFGANFESRIEPRKIIAKELLAKPLTWVKQCQTSKIDLFCWLQDKDKMPAIGDSKRLLIQQGPTSSSALQVVVSLPKSESSVLVRLFDRKSKRLLVPITMRESERDFSDVKNMLVHFDNLQANKAYELLVAASDGQLLDEREVLTLPAKINTLKFAIVSCANDFVYNNGGAEMWEDLWSMQPNFILQIGDNTYADVKNNKKLEHVTEQHIWERYLETRSQLSIYKKHQLIPIFAVWDDHDYGANDGDRTFALKDKSLQIFRDFYAQDDMPPFFQKGPSVSSSFTIEGQRFLLMDDRYYRSVNKPSPVLLKEKGAQALPIKPDNQDYQTHFGKEGEAFLYKNLNQDRLPTWLISGDQFFGAYHIFESYEGNQPESFKSFLGQLKKAKAKVVFVSGDRHLSELMEIDKQDVGYDTYEITSSAIHAGTRPDAWARDRNPRQLAGASGVYNYTIVESAAKKNKLNFKITAFKDNKVKLYERTLKLGE